MKKEKSRAHPLKKRLLKTGIYGVGLIGGSLGKALKTFSSSYIVYGFGRNPEKLKKAEKIGAVDYWSVSEKYLNELDILVLCVPVELMEKIFFSLKPHLKKDCVITDAGSTKTALCGKLTLAARPNIFIGSHPMAGSEKIGVDNADAYLFENAVCVITAAPRKKGYKKIADMWKTAGAKILNLTPEKHDYLVSKASHIPHIAAAALVNLTDGDKQTLGLAAGGFKDTTRIASGDPYLWMNIVLSNPKYIEKSLNEYISVIKKIKSALLQKNKNEIIKFFKDARERRSKIPSYQKGIISSVHDIIVSVPDKPGILAKITSLIAKEKINIIDIEVLRVREGYGGSIKLSFLKKQDKDRALKVLKEARLA